MNRRTSVWGALFTVAFLGVSVAANAQAPAKDLREVRKDLREERKELREDRKELREDRKELRDDVKAGADPKEIKEDRKELREDRKELREDRREFRKARRKEIRERWGETLKKPEAKAELKVHARRMARLVRAKAVATEAGKTDLVARIDKLIEKEKARHQGAMDKVKGSAGGTP